MSYVEMCELMKRLGFMGTLETADSKKFIKERGLLNDMWILIAQNAKVDVLSLLSFLLAILGADIRQQIKTVEQQIGSDNLNSLLR